MKEKLISLVHSPREWVLVVGALLWGIAMMLYRKIEFTGSVGDLWDNNTFAVFGWMDIGWLLLYAGSGYLALKVLNVFVATVQKKSQEAPVSLERSKCKCFFVAFGILFLAWLPYLLSFAPGSVLEDSLLSIAQAMGDVPLDNHHPVLYTLFVGLFVRGGAWVKSVNFGVFLYTLCQYTLMAATLAYLISWLWKKGISRIFVGISLAYFALLPIFPIYANIMWKDPLFSCALLLYMIWICDLVQSKGALLSNKKWLAGYGGISVFVIFFRNNGFLIFVICSVTLLIVYRKKMKRYGIMIAVIALLSMFIQGPVYNWMGIHSIFAESVGVPLQQMCRVVAVDGNITDEQKEFLFQMIPEEEIKNCYTPCLVDPIKWNESFDNEFLESHKVEFIKTWAQMLIPNFSEYVKAYALDTFGFWAPHVQNSYGYADAYISENGYEIYRVDLWEKLFGASIAEGLGTTRIWIGSGSFVWCMLISGILLLYQGRKKACISLFPALLTWVTVMIATPVAFSLRYVYIVALGLPIFIFLPFEKGSEE